MGLQQLKACDYISVNFDLVHCDLTCEICSISPVRLAQGENIICLHEWLAEPFCSYNQAAIILLEGKQDI